ncbi:MAG: hypothetical protein K6E11_00040 [Bacilli bacterium]|nr:hypothetical protein [Bacilli bacterium]
MNKKIFILSLISPLLVSCKGGVVSLEEAKEVNQNLSTMLKNESYEYKKFTFKYSAKNGEEAHFVKGTYDAKNQFFSSYVVDYVPGEEEGEFVYKTKEFWSYVKNDSSGVKKYYDLIRYDGASKDGEPVVTYIDGGSKPKDYKEELWTNKRNEIINSFHDSYLGAIIENINSLIKYKELVEDSDITFSSSSGLSLYVDASLNYTTYEYQIDKGKLLKANVNIDENHYRTFECNYNQAQIIYLNL